MKYTPTLESVCGTSKRNSLTTDFATLSHLFGNPHESDGHKVTSEWAVRDSEGNVITIYDWKATEAYDSRLPTLEELKRASHVEFSVGGYDQQSAQDFVDWFNSKTA